MNLSELRSTTADQIGDRVRVKENYPDPGVCQRTGTIVEPTLHSKYVHVQLDHPPRHLTNPVLCYPGELEPL